ncbi:MAG TPA: Panacea domain-containing protein [Isosphaeraceae bacterium]|jgi:uncharacterized phage-associated protein
MNFRFNFEKTLQAAGVLLCLDGDRMERIRLLKLLYIADRELLTETGRTLTGDRAVAMTHGPVLSRVYDLLKGEAARAGEWGRSIHSEGHAVVLRDDPGRGELSRREVEKLTEVTERFRNTDDWTLSEATHGFEEWSNNYVEGTSTPIPWLDVLVAENKEELVEIIERDEADRRYLDDLLGG